MYSFDGSFKRKPVQSLGGASKKEPKNTLLQRTQDERRKREDQRLRTLSSIKIQSFYRASCVRASKREEVRQSFDQTQTSIKAGQISAGEQVLGELMRKLCFCHRQQYDQARVVWLSQLLVKEKQKVVKLLLLDLPTTTYQIQSLLQICCRHLEHMASGSTPLSAPLRLLEVYLDPSTYTKSMPSSQALQIVKRLFGSLISHGYYKCMRCLVEQKVPSSIERTTVAPTPMSASIFDMITKPLQLMSQVKDTSFRSVVMQSLCCEFFCTAYSEQVAQYILPALAYGQFQFPLVDLLHALLPENNQIQSEVKPLAPPSSQAPSLTVESSAWLLCAVLVLAETRLKSLTRDKIKVYLLVLQQVVPQVQQLSSASHQPRDDSDSEEEDHEMLVDGPTGSFSSLSALKAECLRLLNLPDHVRAIVSVMTHDPDPSILLAVCTVCHTLLSQTKLSVHQARFLYSLAFNPVFLKRLWHACISTTTPAVTGSPVPHLQRISRGLELSQPDIDRIVPLLSIFCSLFSHSLMSLHDAEFYGEEGVKSRTMPFVVDELRPMSLVLRDVCLGIVKISHPETSHHVTEGYRSAFESVGLRVQDPSVTVELIRRQKNTWFYLFRVVSHLLKQLYARDARRQFCPTGHWLAEHVDSQLDRPYKLFEAQNAVGAWTFGAFSVLHPTPQGLEDIMLPSVKEARKLTILMELPFVIPFQDRVKIFQKLVEQDKKENQGELHHFGRGQMIQISVRRNYLYEDAFEKLSPENEPNMKLRMQVQLTNFAGLNEAGIDGGGLFREFLSEVLKTAFDPNRGFFRFTSDQLLYPNPQAQAVVDNMTNHYYFIGRLLGKALYENMLVELPFASFFLSKILGRHGGEVDIHHLASLDPEMYKNLLFLKHYDGDVSDLGLDFTITNDRLGEVTVDELKPGGKDITVDNYNKIEYIHLMAHHKLNRQIRAHCQAFRHGLADVINLEWLRMFDHHELQVLISGAVVPVDLDDLRVHTKYSGGYASDHQVIQSFWRVLVQFSDRQKRQLLKFVTSCSRPPLLGFKDLYPAFCIHNAGDDADRLPTASTCMNLLKLPNFSNEETLRQKLLYAIESNAGFELS